jgi:hypothetical protein
MSNPNKLYFILTFKMYYLRSQIYNSIDFFSKTFTTRLI